jgi:Ulp1 family protease
MNETPLKYRPGKDEIKLKGLGGINYISKLSQSMKNQEKGLSNRQKSIFEQPEEYMVDTMDSELSKKKDKQRKREVKGIEKILKDKEKLTSNPTEDLLPPLNLPSKFPKDLSELKSHFSEAHLDYLKSLNVTDQGLATLVPPSWINDEIINAFFISLSHIAPSYFSIANSYFLSPNLSPADLQKRLKKYLFPSTTHLLIPLFTHRHWTLLLLHLPSHTLFMFDSYFLITSVHTTAVTIDLCHRLAELEGELGGKWEGRVERVSQQKNSFD